MRVHYFLVLAVLFSACKSSRPTRPSFNKNTLESHPDDPPEGDPDFPDDPEIDPITGKPIVKKDLSLKVVDTRSTMRIGSVDVLINKLKVVTALNDDSEAVKLARKSDQSLGAYDYAQGVLPENKWSLDKMVTWFKVVDQACRDTGLLGKIQQSGGEKEFIENAYGRDILVAETDLLKELKLSGARRARVICTAILSSGEFVSL